MNYRQLTQTEIEVLEANNCWAEDWDRVMVAETFRPYGFHRVLFYGDIRLGSFDKQVEISKGFFKHAGISDATLRNVTVGNDCLIEKVGNFINNYTIGNDCYISNICTLETTDDATYGEGSVISVLNEMGDGNVTLFRELNSQVAAFMVKHFGDKELRHTLQQLIEDELAVVVRLADFAGDGEVRGKNRLAAGGERQRKSGFRHAGNADIIRPFLHLRDNRFHGRKPLVKDVLHLLQALPVPNLNVAVGERELISHVDERADFRIAHNQHVSANILDLRRAYAHFLDSAPKFDHNDDVAHVIEALEDDEHAR